MVPYIFIMILVGIAVLAILSLTIAFYHKKSLPPTDYYTLFIMGVIFIITGLAQIIIHGPTFSAIFLLGVVFTITGLIHKQEWKKNHRSWNQLSKKEQKFKLIVLLILGLIVLIGLVLFLYMGLTSF